MTSHADELAAYLAQGRPRSLRRLAKELGVAPTTAMEWSRREHWQKLADGYDARVLERQIRVAADENGDPDSMHARHAVLGRELVEAGRELVESGDAAGGLLVERGVRLERLAEQGGPGDTSYEETWGRAMTACLDLVSVHLVPHLPKGKDDLAVLDFADAINAINPDPNASQ